MPKAATLSLEDITSRLAPFPEIRFALLFGSRARGDARPDSDIDVAAFVDPATTPSRGSTCGSGSATPDIHARARDERLQEGRFGRP